MSLSEKICWINLSVIAFLFFTIANMEWIKKAWRIVTEKWWIGYVVLFVIVAVPVLIVDLSHGMFSNGKIENIIAELNGLVLDLLLIVIGLGIYDRIKDKKGEIKRLLEELDDYKYWKGEESTFRRIGIIKRLIKHRATNINLKDHNFENGKFVGTDFSKLILRNTRFNDCGFDGCGFDEAVIKSTWFANCTFNNINFKYGRGTVFFSQSNFNNSKFDSRDISLTDFEKCTFRNCEIINCDLTFSNFKDSVFSGKISFQGSNFKDTDLEGVFFPDLRRDELTQKFHEWIGAVQTDEYIFKRYYIRNLDDPAPWDVEHLFPIGSPRKFIKKEQGCFIHKIQGNPYKLYVPPT